ncbi:unnamed protein product [Paramecium sonneborni]|uniref:Transmembrane protein n=1 Tax=Paramecium sonneborni TaxID=65129 RepID=A0A8S1PSA2_9CILI|nr:unnamed protein product [Paramecium sonneborni]
MMQRINYYILMNEIRNGVQKTNQKDYNNLQYFIRPRSLKIIYEPLSGNSYMGLFILYNTITKYLISFIMNKKQTNQLFLIKILVQMLDEVKGNQAFNAYNYLFVHQQKPIIYQEFNEQVLLKRLYQYKSNNDESAIKLDFKLQMKKSIFNRFSLNQYQLYHTQVYLNKFYLIVLYLLLLLRLFILFYFFPSCHFQNLKELKEFLQIYKLYCRTIKIDEQIKQFIIKMSEANCYQKFGINQSVYNSESPKLLTPILKIHHSKSDGDIDIRQDSFGNLIRPGQKKHRIQFKDKNEVFIVENWKQYNTDMAIQESPCLCTIL